MEIKKIEVLYDGDEKSEIFNISYNGEEPVGTISYKSELAQNCINAKIGDIITLSSGIKLKLVNKE